MPHGDIDFEIVGLEKSNNGRSCSSHSCCGAQVVVGDLLRLVNTCVTINDITETAIKLVLVADGVDCCTVAYVPRLQQKLPHVVDNINKICIVKELYKNSSSKFKKEKNLRTYGMAGCVLIDLFHQNE